MSLFVDVIAFLLLAYNAFSGYKKGTLISLLSILSIISSYIASYYFGPVLGTFIQNKYEIINVISMTIGSIIVFIIVGIVFGFIINLIRRRQHKKQSEGNDLSLISRFTGAGISVFVSFIFISLLLWGYNLFKVGVVKNQIPSINNSFISDVTKPFVQNVSYFVLNSVIKDDEKSAQIAYLMANPEETAEVTKKIIKTEVFQNLYNSEDFYNSIKSGEEEQILANQEFQHFLNDEEIISYLEELGLENDEDYKNILAKEFAKFGGKINDFENDPEVKENIESLRNEGLTKKENLMNLIKDKRFLKLLNKFLKGENSDV